MKKAKIFLSAIAVFAIVGGALAFKAKTFGLPFCTKVIAGGPGTCQASFIGKVDPNKVTSFYYTPTENPAACGQVDCPTTTYLTEVE